MARFFPKYNRFCTAHSIILRKLHLKSNASLPTFNCNKKISSARNKTIYVANFNTASMFQELSVMQQC